MGRSSLMEESYSTFGIYTAHKETPRSWLSSLAASSFIYVGFAALLVTVTATKTIVEKKQIELTFVEKVVKEPPPPPPPPPPAPEVKPAPPAAMAPVVRPDQKIR